MVTAWPASGCLAVAPFTEAARVALPGRASGGAHHRCTWPRAGGRSRRAAQPGCPRAERPQRVHASGAPHGQKLAVHGGLRLSSGSWEELGLPKGEKWGFRRGEAEGRFRSGGSGHLEGKCPPSANGNRNKDTGPPTLSQEPLPPLRGESRGAESGGGEGAASRQHPARPRHPAGATFPRRGVALTS